MIITNRDVLEKYSRKHVIVKSPIEKWIAEVTAAQWVSFKELRLSFPSADYAGNGRVIFNIKGNDYRLIVIVLYVINVVEIRWVGTHAEYDKIKDCSII
ncbi:MAG: type II toxin-antitoxin system HigB family toxin [Bacteroidales bacterium]|nr:type II toxin-antitoxin system HigB family toxin [Bacteroidales bacterium]